ncbi:MFS transporter [Aliidongia dinghuensis]|uniref:MFS transporter n=1 Tax=Aliidongia dinghuensis TaxID=1867774 RepID=UPI001662F880|nr:MFS transporter [Aliidongia dinghuensis]
MGRILRNVGALLFGVSILLLGAGLFQTFLSLRMAYERFGQLTIGLILAAYFAGFMAGSMLSGRVVRRVGYIRAFAIFSALLSSSVLFQALVVDPVAWTGLRACGGFAIAGLFLVTESWLNHRSDEATRGQVLALYVMIEQVATGLGQYLIDLLPTGGTGSFILTAGLFVLALIPVAATNAEAPLPAAHSTLSIGQLFRMTPLGVLGSLFAGLINAAFAGLAPIYAQGIGLSTPRISVFMSVTILGALLFQLPVGRLSDRFDRRSVLLVVIISVTAVSGVLSAAEGFGLWSLLALALVFGGVSQVIYPVTAAHANDYVAEEDRVAAAGALLFAYGIGATVGPLLGAALMEWLGPAGLFVYCTITSAALAGVVALRMARRSARPSYLQTPFQLVSNSTPAAAELDPRTHPRKTPAP